MGLFEKAYAAIVEETTGEKVLKVKAETDVAAGEPGVFAPRPTSKVVKYTVDGHVVCVFEKKLEWHKSGNSRLRDKQKMLTQTRWDHDGIKQVTGIDPGYKEKEFRDYPMDFRSGITYTPPKSEIVDALNAFAKSHNLNLKFV